MIHYDQHMHTLFSPDSTELFENYLLLTKGDLVTTEHLDFNDHYNNGQDTKPDYEGYVNKIASLNEEYGHRVFKGIEIGYREDQLDKTLEYLDGKEFDVKLLSVHQNLEFDFLNEAVFNVDLDQHVPYYFGKLAEAMQAIPDANVLTHFDYGIRLFKEFSVDDLMKYEDSLRHFVQVAIDMDFSIELNTRSMYQYGHVDLYDKLLEIYAAMGGVNVSLGSDAHSTDFYLFHFEEACDLLSRHGFTYTNRYRGGVAEKMYIK